MERKVEILAPAGSFEGCKAAISAGCDAVYIGGQKFGARAFADNLTTEKMLEAIDYAHLYHKKIYLTVNTLLTEREIQYELYEYLLPFYLHGVDAFIVQDIGVMNFIHTWFPEVQIHASTQMTITHAIGADWLKEYGVTRVVPARELTIDEIGEMRSKTDLELEVFVHGALCYSYSGQCFMSSFQGGRSGNRGMCAQPCRLCYQANGKSGYFLSPKDSCTLSFIPDLIDNGIDSFKIEGRMKRVEYAALTSHLYRKYVDYYQELGRAAYEEKFAKKDSELSKDIKKLMDIYNRGGFTSSYLFSAKDKKSIMSVERPNHSGVLVGTVIQVSGNRSKIHLQEDVFPQDLLEFRNEKGIALYDYTVKNAQSKKNDIETNFLKGSKIKQGDFVYRMKNDVLLTWIRENLIYKETKLYISGEFRAFENEKMTFQVSCQGITAVVEGPITQKAANQPAVSENIKQKLSKTGDTFFHFHRLDIKIGENVFIPVGQLNEIRRNAVEQLKNEICNVYKREKPKDYVPKLGQCTTSETMNTRAAVSVSNMEQCLEVLKNEYVDCVYLNLTRFCDDEIDHAITVVKKAGKQVYLQLPVLFRKMSRDTMKNHGDKCDGFVLKNYEELQFIKREWKGKTFRFIPDYNLYCMNSYAAEFWEELGAERFTAPIELSQGEIKEFGTNQFELFVYGRIPVMTTEGCVKGLTSSCGKDCLTDLKSEKGEKFIVENHCNSCYNVIYTKEPLSIIDLKDKVSECNPAYVRFDFTFETAGEVRNVMNAYFENETVKGKTGFQKHFLMGLYKS